MKTKYVLCLVCLFAGTVAAHACGKCESPSNSKLGQSLILQISLFDDDGEAEHHRVSTAKRDFQYESSRTHEFIGEAFPAADTKSKNRTLLLSGSIERDGKGYLVAFQFEESRTIELFEEAESVEANNATSLGLGSVIAKIDEPVELLSMGGRRAVLTITEKPSLE